MLHRRAISVLLLFSVIVLIVFPEIALSGASEGVELCLKTLIPALFPFMVLSSALLEALGTTHFSILKYICKICKMPPGSENVLLVSLLGGYPVGAKLVSESYDRGFISKKCAARLLGFCNNAGPAFIFGVVGRAFQSFSTVLILWIVHILSAIITGAILPQNETAHHHEIQIVKKAKSSVIKQCVATMGIICGWVILFRILIAYLSRLIPVMLPSEFIVLAAGVLELSNGCILLNSITDPATRFLICSCMISLGGCCVAMQTAGIVHNISLHYYFQGKIIQTAVSVAIAIILHHIMFTNPIPIHYSIGLILLCAITVVIIIYKCNKQNNSSIYKYNAV